MNDITKTLDRFASVLSNYGDAMGAHSLAKPVSESAAFLARLERVT